MRKITALLFSILVCVLTSMSAIIPAQAYIERPTWLPPYIEKDDYSRVTYRDGSTASLLVPVENDLPGDVLMNVSKVIISFDWDQNKTLDLSTNPRQIEPDETERFTVSFTASATEAVSSEIAWGYMIHVEHVNATGGTVDTESRKWDSWWPSLERFVVFSTDQADALDLSRECAAYRIAYEPDKFDRFNASQTAFQASLEALLGDTYYYSHGDYASAKTHYQAALDLYSQALAAEAAWMTTKEEAELDIMLTEADANMAMADAMLRQADAAVNQSYAFILFGLGFVFMGIATIVYAYRKPMTG